MRVSVVGCGGVSVNHLEVLSKMDSVTISSVVDIVTEKADSAAMKYGCKAYYDYDTMLKEDKITNGHARALLGLKSDEQMIELAKKVADNDLSVRDVERIVRSMLDEKKIVVSINKPDAQRRVYMKDLERRVMETLGRKAKINQSAKKKTLELAYDNDDDLAELLELICGKDIFKA